jgi:hypothetical protein
VEWNLQSLARMPTLMASTPAAADLRPWVGRAVRIGYAAKGVIYLLIGTLALRLATGNGGALTDSSGALRAILEQPFGLALLVIVAIGILAYAGWEITSAITDSRRKGSGARGLMSRALTVLKGTVYGMVGVQALRMAVGARASSQDADDYARTAMGFPLGGVLLVLVGFGVAAYGVLQMVNAWKSQFDDDLNEPQLRREGGSWILDVGRAGIGARGLILVLVGIALARAGFDRRPSAASSMPEAMWTLFAQPYGQWLLTAVAAGLMCFGLFQLLHARYARL